MNPRKDKNLPVEEKKSDPLHLAADAMIDFLKDKEDKKIEQPMRIEVAKKTLVRFISQIKEEPTEEGKPQQYDNQLKFIEYLCLKLTENIPQGHEIIWHINSLMFHSPVLLNSRE